MRPFLHINVLELKAVSLHLNKFKDQCQNQMVLVATNSNSLHKQTRRNPLSRDVCSFVTNYDMVPPLQNNSQGKAHSSVPECEG